MTTICQFFGIRNMENRVSLAGIHVFSSDYKVAVLGSIATAPDYQNRGYGQIVTTKICQSLLQKVDHIGLNVKADNHAAISCYQKLGFESIGSYDEFTMERK